MAPAMDLHIGIGGKGGKLLGHRGERERHVGAGVAVGYGKTLSLLISSALSETAAAAIGKQVRMVFAIMGI